jgi:CRISPR-associated exonuclease Cas4
MQSGEMIPVDTKHSNLRTISLPWRKQLVAYALLLDDKFNTQIKRGLIYLLPSRQIMVSNITDEDKAALARDLDRMGKVIESDSVPQKVSREKCGYCEVKKFCGKL